jgi:hypothetical protein
MHRTCNAGYGLLPTADFTSASRPFEDLSSEATQVLSAFDLVRQLTRATQERCSLTFRYIAALDGVSAGWK